MGRRQALGVLGGLAAVVALTPAAVSQAAPLGRAAQASSGVFGYTGGAASQATECAVGQACTYFSDGAAAWRAPAGGFIDSFTVDHGAAGGSQQVALLALSHVDGTHSWTVDGQTGLGQLSSTAGPQSFTLSTPLAVKQGDALAVTVVPDAQDVADGMLVSASGIGGSSVGCEKGQPGAGTTFTDSGCSIAIDDAVVAVSAHMAGASNGGGSGSAGSGGSGSSGSGGSGSSGSGGSGSGGGIPTFNSHPISVYKAAKIKFYRATIIKKLPPAPPIRLLPSHGWGIPVPAHCDAACVDVGTLFGLELGAMLLDSRHTAAAARGRQVELGHVRVLGNGNLRPKLVIGSAFRRRLLRSRHPVRLTVVETITDKRYGFVKRRRQTLLLRP